MQFLMNILIITPYMSYRNINEIASDARRREAFENLLHYFDTGVESLSTEQREMDLDKLVDGMPGPDAEQLKIRISGIVAEHPVMLQVNNQIVTLRKDENGNIKSEAEEMVMNICVILLAMPVASNTAAMAERYGGDHVFASACVSVSTLLSVITVPFITWLIQLIQ